MIEPIPEHPNIQPEFIKSEGYLMKQSRILKIWRKRWVVITQNHIIYTFKESKSYHVPTECFRITQHTSVTPSDEETEKPNSFCISLSSPINHHQVEPEYNFFFYATSPEERQNWIDVIYDLRTSAPNK